MTAKSESQGQSILPPALAKAMLLGAGIAFILIALFLLGAGEPNPEWPEYWFIRPLIIVPIAGAMGGAFYYFMTLLASEGGWKRVLTIVGSLIGYIVVLWLGTVLGLDGTMWN